MDECQSQEQSRCDLRHPENLPDDQALPVEHPTVSLKRKASTDLSGFSPTKPDPRPSPQPSAAPNKPQPFLLASTSTVHAIAPELASINAILRQHCRARLYVRPLAWTMAQPRLLGCRFVFKDLPPGPSEEPENAGNETLQDATDLHQERIRQARFLRDDGVIRRKSHALSHLLETFNIRFSDYKCSLPFSLGGRIVARVNLDCMFSSGSINVYLACLDDANLRSFRSASVYGTSWKPKNAPVDRLRDKKFSSLQPADTAEDPYIVATLIAMAQWQRRRCQERALKDSLSSQTHPSAYKQTEASTVAPGSFEVRALLTASPQGRAWKFHVYKATITSAFLDKFESPSRCYPSDPIQITYSKFHTNSPERLVEQLPRALGLIGKDGQCREEEQARLLELGMGYLERTKERREFYRGSLKVPCESESESSATTSDISVDGEDDGCADSLQPGPDETREGGLGQES